MKSKCCCLLLFRLLLLLLLLFLFLDLFWAIIIAHDAAALLVVAALQYTLLNYVQHLRVHFLYAPNQLETPLASDLCKKSHSTVHQCPFSF